MTVNVTLLVLEGKGWIEQGLLMIKRVRPYFSSGCEPTTQLGPLMRALSGYTKRTLAMVRKGGMGEVS